MKAVSDTVFWDFDGTLAAREGTWPGILLDAVRRSDPTVRVALGELTAGLRGGFPDYGSTGLRFHPYASAWWTATSTVLDRACRNAGIDVASANQAITAVPGIYYEPDSWDLLPGAISALHNTLRAGLRNVVLSNHAPELPRLVADLGREPFVDRTLTSASLGVAKPDPEIFRLALRISGASSDSWMVGNDPVIDVGAARAAGMRAVLVHQAAGERPARSLRSAARLLVRAQGRAE